MDWRLCIAERTSAAASHACLARCCAHCFSVAGKLDIPHCHQSLVLKLVEANWIEMESQERNEPESLAPPALPEKKTGFLRTAAHWVGLFFDYVFGLVAILLGLAVLSAIPILHFFSLGYLLEASARIARSGRIRDGFVGLRPAARFGKIIVAAWIIFLPIRLLHSYWRDANIIDAGSQTAAGLRIALVAAATLAVATIAWAVLRGGKFRHFLWAAPIRFLRWLGEPKFSGNGWSQKFSRLDFSAAVRLADYFKLGFFGFLGGALWLMIPVLILFGAAQLPKQGLSFFVSLIGGVLLGFVVLYLPVIQTRYAVYRRFGEFANWPGARRSFKKAPLALWVSLFVTVLFALPLYILKIELAPREVAWIPNLVFVVFMFPARLLLGWFMSRSLHREKYRHWFFRWTGRIAMLPVAFIYVLTVWVAQYLSWYGSYSLFEQHAFLLPAPMLGL